MKKFIILSMVILLLSGASVLYAKPPSFMPPASGLIKLSDCSGITSGVCLDTDDGKLYVWNGSAVVLVTAPVVGDMRDTAKIDMTNGDTQTALSEANMLANKYVSNQGETVELDVILVAVSYPIQVVFSVEEVLIIEVCPPSGELFDLDGTLLDANDCVDSPAVVGSKMSATRLQVAAGTWIWSLDTIRGAWVDTGATD